MKRLSLHLERCVGCKRCELACMAAHSDTGDILFSSLELPHPKTRIFVESINEKPVPLICRHCEEPPCIDACISGCMQKDVESGIVDNMGHEQECIGCWMCIIACPYSVISTTKGNGSSKSEEEFERVLKCDLCPELEVPACVSSCPNEVLEINNIRDEERRVES